MTLILMPRGEAQGGLFWLALGGLLVCWGCNADVRCVALIWVLSGWLHVEGEMAYA